MKRVKKVLLAVVLAPLVIPLVLLAIPVIGVMEAKAAISLRSFRRREAGRVYLICTSKRNWHDFLKNNVIPVLPDNFRVVWHKSIRGGEYPALVAHLARSHVFGVTKPYIVAVTRRTLLHRSLNSVLQELKSHSKTSEDIRRACAGVVRRTEEELLAGVSAE